MLDPNGQLDNLRKLFAEASPTDPKVINDYVWAIVKALLSKSEEIDALTCRQLLADALRFTIERPSKQYSALLLAAMKVAEFHPEFHFIPFLKIWNLQFLRPEDYKRTNPNPSASNSESTLQLSERAYSIKSSDGFPKGTYYPALVERVAKYCALSMLMRPEEQLPEDQLAIIQPMLDEKGFLPPKSMLVTRIKDVVNREGRKFVFVTLTSPEGLEVECNFSSLNSHPLHPLPEGKRHYVNIGQLYDCLLRRKDNQASLYTAYLSQSSYRDLFPEEIGYVESLDTSHAHIHIYDKYSRHFVAPIQRFSKERPGDFVRFVPIIPKESTFKTAIIVGHVYASELMASAQESSPSLIRQIKITAINSEKGYASWELIDKDIPITERLSPLQTSKGETSPSYTHGYLHIAENNAIPEVLLPPGHPTTPPLGEGQVISAVIFLRRGKDKTKRPHIAQIII